MLSSTGIYFGFMDADGGAEPMSLPQALGRLRVVLGDAYVRTSRDLGLTAPQARLLCAALSPAAVGELAGTLQCDHSNVTRLVDRAAKRGLVHRRGRMSDSRVTMIGLTPKGRRLAERFIDRLEAQTRELREAWPDSRQQSASALLTEISDALDRRTRRGDVPSRRTGSA
jgi:DNA-binding MarR family transcriptional regulator